MKRKTNTYAILIFFDDSLRKTLLKKETQQLHGSNICPIEKKLKLKTHPSHYPEHHLPSETW